MSAAAPVHSFPAAMHFAGKRDVALWNRLSQPNIRLTLNAGVMSAVAVLKHKLSDLVGGWSSVSPRKVTHGTMSWSAHPSPA